MRYLKSLTIFCLLTISLFTLSCKKKSKQNIEEKKEILVNRIMFDFPEEIKTEVLKSISELKKNDVNDKNEYGLNFMNNDVESEKDFEICVWVLNSKENKGFTYIFKNTNRFAKISDKITLPVIFGSEYYFGENIPHNYSRHSLERCLKCIYFTDSKIGIGNYKITKVEVCGDGI
ncbi:MULTISPECIES: hypothetical protein [Flavobacterium]|uniref:Lipoprotein n=1 Tax=Flavobacterium jumunjinense TaxID=998845 RepID=A0ABV5GJD3_9FLAO|nr:MULTISPECIES: hypothetical protein [Flavobacterium]